MGDFEARRLAHPPAKRRTSQVLVTFTTRHTGHGDPSHLAQGFYQAAAKTKRYIEFTSQESFDSCDSSGESEAIKWCFNSRYRSEVFSGAYDSSLDASTATKEGSRSSCAQSEVKGSSSGRHQATTAQASRLEAHYYHQGRAACERSIGWNDPHGSQGVAECYKENQE